MCFVTAVTDGTHVQYFSSYESHTSTTVSNAWAIPVDVRHGVAAVVYNKYATERDQLGNPSTTMLGCQCLDNGGAPPIRIICSLALKEILSYGGTLNNDDDLSFEVVFQNKLTANYLQCNTVEISVQVSLSRFLFILTSKSRFRYFSLAFCLS